MARVKDVLFVIEKIFPPSFADEGDPIGLQVGDPGDQVRGVAVALEATMPVLAETAARGANLLLTHHPLIFRPLSRIEASDPVGAAVHAAVRSGVTIFSCHTNADWAPGGLNDRLAELLRLEDIRPLTPRDAQKQFKLVTFVPAEALDRVSEAVFEAGAGVIGEYRKCSFRIEGTGTFLPGDKANPYSGTKGELAKEPEVRLEVLVPASVLDKTVAAMKKAHPYEEVAFDVYPLAPMGSSGGVARIGSLAQPSTPKVLAAKLKEVLHLSAVRCAGPLDAPIRSVVLCTGSGASLMREAASHPGAAFVTGDLGYHAARLAEQIGLPVIDIGHFGGEIGFVDLAAGLLREGLQRAQIDVPVFKLDVEKDPFQSL